MEVRRSNSLLPLSNCRLSRNGRANTFMVWAAFLTSGLSARYSTFVSDVPFAAIITFVCSHRAKVFGMVDGVLVAGLYGFFVRVVA